MSEDATVDNPIVIQVKQEWCKSCAICVAVCPKAVLEMKNSFPLVVNLAACTQCAMCEIHCPDFAITVVGPKRKATSGSAA